MMSTAISQKVRRLWVFLKHSIGVKVQHKVKVRKRGYSSNFKVSAMIIKFQEFLLGISIKTLRLVCTKPLVMNLLAC